MIFKTLSAVNVQLIVSWCNNDVINNLCQGYPFSNVIRPGLRKQSDVGASRSKEIMPWPEQTEQADEISSVAQGVALEGKQGEYELIGNNLQDNVIRAANENTPQESQMDEDDQNDSMVTEVEWVQCAGQVGSLVTHLNKLKKDLENSEVPNPEKFLVEAKDMVMCCRDMLVKLEENIGAALAKLQNEGPPVTEKDLSEPVPSDPGLRPTPLSDSQRLYLDHNNLFCLIILAIKILQLVTNRIVSALLGIPSIHFWNIASKKTQHFVLYV